MTVQQEQLDLIRLLRDEAHSEIERWQSEVAKLQKGLDEAKSHIDKLAMEAKGYDLALERHGEQVGDAQQRFDELNEVDEVDGSGGPETSRSPDFSSMARTDAVMAILTEQPEGMSPAEIRDAMHEVGREDQREAVSAALAYLKKSGRVRSPRRGLYIAHPSEREG